MFYPTYWSMVSVWIDSETYAHGFLVYPVCLYLVWQQRHTLSSLEKRVDFRALFVLVGAGFAWLTGNLVDVLVVQQFAVVAMVPAIVWLLAGFHVLKTITFPMAFTLFAVPFGEFLVRPMMEFTAQFTVAAIRLVGIPVYQEGLFFTLPTGSWSVVKACSGVRYIIASLSLGCIYAYLSYHRWWKRLLFILLAILMPILANGIRAFMIVMIGHFSNMTLATGVDHLVYGWVFFGIVMFLMFWIGSYWQDESQTLSVTSGRLNSSGNKQGYSSYGLVSILGIFLIAVWPGWSYISANAHSNSVVIQPLDSYWDQTEWTLSKEPLSDWQPAYKNPSQEMHVSFTKGEQKIGVYLAQYLNQEQNAELINSTNRLIGTKDKNWRELSLDDRVVEFEGLKLPVREAELRSGDSTLLVWQWNLIAGTESTNDYYAKGLQAWHKLIGTQNAGDLAVIVYSKSGKELDKFRESLRGFVLDVYPQFKARLDRDKATLVLNYDQEER